MLPSIQEALGLIYKLGMVVLTSYPSTWKVKAGGLELNGHLQLVQGQTRKHDSHLEMNLRKFLSDLLNVLVAERLYYSNYSSSEK